MDLNQIRRRLMERREPWKTLEELTDERELRVWLADEFPDRSFAPTTSRREILRLIGISLAAASVTGCRGLFMPQLHLQPYVDGPAEQTYGQPLRYRSALIRRGYGIGIEVLTRDGRPLKVEGNANHPASRGSSDVVSQASILQFYDPERSKAPLYNGHEDSWDGFFQMADKASGTGLRILTETVTSPTLARQIALLSERVPGVKWHSYEPLNRDFTHIASQIAFGRSLSPIYRLDHLSVFVGIDYDLDRPELAGLASARGLVDQPTRTYVVASTPTLLHSLADHTISLSPPELARFVESLAGEVGVEGYRKASHPLAAQIAKDLAGSPGRSCIAIGETQSPELQALGFLINEKLGNLGKSLSFVETSEKSPLNQAESMRELITDMSAGKVGFLLILGGNPAYNVPAEAGFAEAASHVPFKVHHGLYQDETARICDWHLPATHEFENWSDVCSIDGTASIVQPILQPIYAGRSSHSLLATLVGESLDGLQIVRSTWKNLSDEQWDDGLRRGVIDKPKFLTPTVRPIPFHSEVAPKEFVALFRADPSLDDGRNANNGWLQETPNPHTGLVWDNAILVSFSDATSLSLQNGDHVNVEVENRSIEGPIWITPGQADGCVTLHLGGGRSSAGVVGDGVGYNAYSIRKLDQPHQTNVLVTKSAGRTDLVSTHSHHRMEGRDLIKSVNLGGGLIQEKPNYGFDDLTEKYDHTPGVPQWGMSIDLDRCIGCNACVVACQAENNIPTVGKEQVRRGREMHWIRIDRYYAGANLENPKVLLQPVTCMHCETAPCEPVCPVAATVHTHEGLNQMVYNRCVGTRYCSNNCPYKVRRFNYLNYQMLQPNFQPERSLNLLKLLNNPDVTVRSRGVMEKCTYCVQRLSAARIAAQQEDRQIRDGEAITACAQACPTKTIVFGDLTDPNAQVTALKKDPRQYPLLPEELTVPRTTYLARIDNPYSEGQNA